MDAQNHHLDQLAEIRSIMQRSTRFLSLSGLSGVVIGIIALIGAGVGYWFLLTDPSKEYVESAFNLRGPLTYETIRFLLLDALIVLVLSFATAFLFTWRQASKTGEHLFDPIALKLAANMLIPLVAGGVFCLILVWYKMFILVTPLTLLFYGLALMNASKYTLPEIWWLGLCELILGLAATIIIGESLLFWAIGFGVLHIVYGLVMYYRYERSGSTAS